MNFIDKKIEGNAFGNNSNINGACLNALLLNCGFGEDGIDLIGKMQNKNSSTRILTGKTGSLTNFVNKEQ